jgi:hypothetical protein
MAIARRRITVSLMTLVALAGTATAAPVTWTGAGDGWNWFDGRNWNNSTYPLFPNIAPQAGQDVIINANAAITVPGVAASVNSITVSGNATLTIPAGCSLGVLTHVSGARVQTAGTFTVAGQFRNGTLTYSGGQLTADMRLINSQLVLLSGAPASFTVQGTATLSGGLSKDQRVALVADGFFPAGTLNLVGPFVNAGVITLTPAIFGASLELNALNAPLQNNGTLTVSAGLGGGVRRVNGGLINLGSAVFAGRTDFGPGTYTSSGSLTFGNTATFAPGSSITIAGGSVEGAGHLNASQVTFAFLGGALNTGEVRLTHAAITFGPDALGPASLLLRGTNSFAGRLRANQSIELLASSATGNAVLNVTGDLINDGAILTSNDTPSALSAINAGRLINTDSGVILLAGGSGGPAVLNTDGVINDGVLAIDAQTTFTRGQHVNTGSTIITGALTILGNAQSFTMNDGVLDAADGFFISGAAFTYNRGAVFGRPIAADAAVVFGPDAVNPILVEVRGQSSFSGNLRAGQTLAVVATGAPANLALLSSNMVLGGRLLLDSDPFHPASISGAAHIDGLQGSEIIVQGSMLSPARSIRAASLMHRGQAVFNAPTDLHIASLTNANQFTLNAPVRFVAPSTALHQLAGTFSAGPSRLSGANVHLTYSGGVLSGVPVLTDSTAQLNAPGLLTLRLRGQSTLLGTVHHGQLVQIEASPGRDATLAIPNPLTNNGSIVLSSEDSARSSALAIASTLSNTISGSIVFAPGLGGTRAVTAGTILNNGSIQVNAPTALSNATLTNTNNIGISAPLTIGPGAAFNQNDGQTNTASQISVNAGAFAYNDGVLIGAPTLINAELALGSAATQPATFTLHGHTTLRGNVRPGTTLRSVATPAFGSASITAPASLTNAGVIELATLSPTLGSSLHVQGDLAVPGRLVLPPRTAASATGALTLAPSTTLAIGFASSNAQFGSLSAAGTATLAGSFQAQVEPGFNAPCNSNLAFVSGSSRVGTFSSASAPSSVGGFQAFLLYTSTGASIIVASPADIARTDGTPGPDGILDNGDFVLFLSAFFAGCSRPGQVPCSPADIARTDGTPGADGLVNNGDFNLFISSFFLGCQ